MADRDRSRSPERGAAPHSDDAPPADAQAHSDGGDNGGEGGNPDEVKLYVGNLDYSKSDAF